MGALLIILAIFALQLGIDNDPGWGKGRITLLTLGVVILLSLVLYFQRAPIARGLEVIQQRWRSSVWAAWIDRYLSVPLAKLQHLPGVRWVAASPARQNRLIFVVVSVLFAGLVTWFTTGGSMMRWQPYFHAYFDRQAEAFLSGQLALLEKPDPRLAELADPYDYEARGGIAYPWDVSYYQGKYYQYWGPVPAALAAGLKWIRRDMLVEDQVLLVGFLLATILALAGIVLILRQVKYPMVPFWGAFWLCAAGCINLPWLYTLIRPGVYETAITAGAYFLTAGYLGLLIHFIRGHPGWLAAGGTGLGLALASRITLLPAVIWTLLISAVFLGRDQTPSKSHWIKRFLWMGVPVVFSLVLIGWFNAARFGNPFESGLNYQLSIAHFPDRFGEMFSLRYLIPNLYAYLFRLPGLESSFPYLAIPYNPEQSWPWFIRLPEQYIYHEPLVGILFSIPLVFLSLVALYTHITDVKWKLRAANIFPHGLASWLVWSLAGGAVMQLGVVLLYYFSAQRFILDFAPELLLLSIIGGFEILTRKKSGIVLTAIVLICVVTMLVGFLGTLQGIWPRFEDSNPGLIAWFLQHMRPLRLP